MKKMSDGRFAVIAGAMVLGLASCTLSCGAGEFVRRGPEMRSGIAEYVVDPNSGHHLLHVAGLLDALLSVGLLEVRAIQELETGADTLKSTTELGLRLLGPGGESVLDFFVWLIFDRDSGQRQLCILFGSLTPHCLDLTDEEGDSWRTFSTPG